MLGNNLKYAIRRLCHQPLISIAVAVMIGAGMGTTISSMALIEALLLKVYPYANQARMVYVGPMANTRGGAIGGTATANYWDIAERAKGFAALGFAIPKTEALGPAGSGESIGTVQLTPSMFAVTGIRPQLGAPWPADGRTIETTVLISYTFWQQHFGGRQDVIGQALKIGGRDYTVAGVLSKGTYILLKSTKVYRPLLRGDTDLATADRNVVDGTIFGLLPPGEALSRANAELREVRASILAAHPELGRRWNTPGAEWKLAAEDLRRNTFKFGGLSIIPIAVMSMFGVALCILLMCAVNICMLFLGMAGARRGEFAVRTALGASPFAIFSQLAVENICLYFGGWLVGAFLGLAIMTALRLLGADALEIGGSLRLSVPVLAVSLLLAIVLGTGLALMPAAIYLRLPVAEVMRGAGRGASLGRGAIRLLSSIVVFQVAAAFVLVYTTGMMLETCRNIVGADVGFDPKNVLVARSAGGVSDKSAGAAATNESILRQLRAIPGVVSAGSAQSVPFSSGVPVIQVTVGGERDPADARLYVVSPGYLEAMRIALLSGRRIEDSDTGAARRVVVVDAEFLRAHRGERNGLGGAVTIDGSLYSIVGLVGTVKHYDVRETVMGGSVYVPAAQSGNRGDPLYVVRALGNPAAITAPVRDILSSRDSTRPKPQIDSVQRAMDDLFDRRERFIVKVLEGAALLSLTLASIGIYGLWRFFVSQRTKEIAIRIALGARHRELFLMYVRQSLRFTGIGIVTGTVLACVASSFGRSLFYGMRWFNIDVQLGSILVTAVAMCLTAMCAVRGVFKVNPATTIREV